MLFLLVGPSGVGKTTILGRLLEDIPELERMVSCTTRGRKKSEPEDYYRFMTREEFLKGVDAGKFFEYFTVHENLYGTLNEDVNRAVRLDKLVINELDVNGAIYTKAKLGDSVVTIFISVESTESYLSRMLQRGDSREEAHKRMKRTNYEISQANKFDYIVYNNNLDEAVKEIKEIILGKYRENLIKLKYVNICE